MTSQCRFDPRDRENDYSLITNENGDTRIIRTHFETFYSRTKRPARLQVRVLYYDFCETFYILPELCRNRVLCTVLRRTPRHYCQGRRPSLDQSVRSDPRASSSPESRDSALGTTWRLTPSFRPTRGSPDPTPSGLLRPLPGLSWKNGHSRTVSGRVCGVKIFSTTETNQNRDECDEKVSWRTTASTETLFSPT